VTSKDSAILFSGRDDRWAFYWWLHKNYECDVLFDSAPPHGYSDYEIYLNGGSRDDPFKVTIFRDGTHRVDVPQYIPEWLNVDDVVSDVLRAAARFTKSLNKPHVHV